jgi:hypothetical protein
VVDELSADPEVPPPFRSLQLAGERPDDDLEHAAGGERRAGGFQVVQEHVAFGIDRVHGLADHGLNHRGSRSEVVLDGRTVAVAARLADVLKRDVVDATLVHEDGGGVEKRLLP